MKPALLAGALALGATVAGAQTASDPLEGFNRGVQRFNDGLDEAVLKPVAEGYRQVVPSFVRTGVANFFGNLGDGWSAVNHLLQGKPGEALDMTLRVAVNTTFGLGGLLDVAGEAGIERRSEDFGQTLGVWGVPAGPYLVLPLLGPSSLRDATGRPLDMAATSVGLVTDRDGTRALGTALSIVDTRASLLGATRLLDDIALDRYTFLRDAYLARRKNQVWDGNPPEGREDPREDDPK
ncbi:MAG: VacJ family lipoprotein [Rubrivivax sp.]